MADFSMNFADVTEISLNGQTVTKIGDGVNTLWEHRTPIGSPLRVVNNVAGSAITVTLTRNGSPDDIDIEYSTDNVNWNTWTETNGVRSMSVAQNGSLYLRGNNPNGLNPTESQTNYYSFTADKKYAMAGDIRSLISRYEIEEIPDGAFMRFFFNSTTLDNVSYVGLKATRLGKSAYRYLFNGCTGLRFSPHILPAATASEYAYNAMFNGCSSLGVMPIISATSFGNYACMNMFSGCSALTKQWATATATDSAKTNIAFTIASSDAGSFNCMFQVCTSLVNAGGITATQTTDWGNACFNAAFYGCTALASAPSITFGSFASGTAHCQNMFYNCTSLVSTPNIHLNATTVYQQTYKSMYRGCTKLTTAPEIKATTLYANANNGSCAAMFYGCTALTYIKVNFTDWNSGNYTNSWTYNCNSYGRFDCPTSLPQTKNASGNTTNPHYIPYNFSVNANPKVTTATVSKTGGGTNSAAYYSWATVKFSTSGMSGVTYYINYGTSSPNNPSTTSYNRKLDGTGSNSEASSELRNSGSVSAVTLYIKVLSVKEGLANSDILSTSVKTG